MTEVLSRPAPAPAVVAAIIARYADEKGATIPLLQKIQETLFWGMAAFSMKSFMQRNLAKVSSDKGGAIDVAPICPKCGVKNDVTGFTSGANAQCPKCGTVFTVP